MKEHINYFANLQELSNRFIIQNIHKKIIKKSQGEELTPCSSDEFYHGTVRLYRPRSWHDRFYMDRCLCYWWRDRWTNCRQDTGVQDRHSAFFLYFFEFYVEFLRLLLHRFL